LPFDRDLPNRLAARVRPFAFPNFDVAFAARLGGDHLDLATRPAIHTKNSADRARCGADGAAHYTTDRPSSLVTPGGSFFSATNRSLRVGDTRNGGYDGDGKCTEYCISFHDGSIFMGFISIR
jgi:hypothetical protein